LQSFQGVKGLSKNCFFFLFLLWGGGFYGFVLCRVKFIVKEVVLIFYDFCFWGVLLESFVKMSESSSVKNLAITDKVQKPGGCVGIFFQLIDWKKRLVKKKLFSKKLLTPG